MWTNKKASVKLIPGKEEAVKEHQNDDLAKNETEHEKQAEAPDAEGGHALLKPQIYFGGGGKMVIRVKMKAKEQFAVELYNYVKSAVENSYIPPPKQEALGPSRCPEDWMGEVIV